MFLFKVAEEFICKMPEMFFFFNTCLYCFKGMGIDELVPCGDGVVVQEIGELVCLYPGTSSLFGTSLAWFHLPCQGSISRDSK